MRVRGTHLLVLISMCGLIASGVGLLTNVAGLFFSPIMEELAISKGSVSLTLTICNIAFALGGMITPRLLNEQNLKIVIIAATALVAGATAALGLCHSIVTMYILSAVRGFAAGCVGMVFATTVVGNWFKSGLGLVTSITFGFSGIAGAVFSPIISAVIGGMGWRGAYFVTAVIIVLLNIPAILFVPSLDPRSKGLLAYGDEGKVTARGAKKASFKRANSGAVSGVAFLLVFAYAVICSGLTGLPQHFPGMADTFGFAAAGATMLSVCMVANTCGKIALGALVARIGARISCLIFCALIVLGLLLFIIVPRPFTLILGAVLFGLCYSLATVGISMLTRAVFGDANYERVYPTMSLGGNVANAVFSSIIGFMYDFSGGYMLTLWVMLAMTVITAVLVVMAYAVKPNASPRTRVS